MKRGMLMVTAVATMAGGGATGAQAATAYDADLASPGWYDGTGNPNGGFTVTTDNGIELGLRAKYRHNPAVIHSSDNNYTVVAGPETLATSGGNVSAPNRAAWNYEFSINLGTSGYTLSNIIAELTISDLNAGTSITVDPLTHWSDNATSGNVGAQNSQNATFGDFPLNAIPGYTFDMNAINTYTFTLDVRDSSRTLLASDTINVNAVPLPASAWGGMALLGVMGGFAGLKRLRAVKA